MGEKHFSECTLHHLLPVSPLQEGSVGKSNPALLLLDLLRLKSDIDISMIND